MTISLPDLLLYCGALLVLFLTPGPVWLAIMARALSGGFSAGCVDRRYAVAACRGVRDQLDIIGIRRFHAGHALDSQRRIPGDGWPVDPPCRGEN